MKSELRYRWNHKAARFEGQLCITIVSPALKARTIQSLLNKAIAFQNANSRAPVGVLGGSPQPYFVEVDEVNAS